MSMLTHCAACGTAFRITTEQLIAHQGKVRCGVCHVVFNALADLVHTPPDFGERSVARATATPVEQPARAAHADASAARTDSAVAVADRAQSAGVPPVEDATRVEGATPLDRTAPYPLLDSTVFAASPSPEPAPHSVAGLATPDATSAALVLGGATPRPGNRIRAPGMASAGAGADARTDASPRAVVASDAGAGSSAAEAANDADAASGPPPNAAPKPAHESSLAPSSVEAAPAGPGLISAVPAARPRFAWWSAAGALLALSALAAQGAYFYRNEIGAHYPEAKPALSALCSQLACTFDTPRDAASITIESHDLQADPANKNVLALVALLRNRAGFAQEAPHLELTLMDGQDAALVRRVFTPRDYATMRMGANTELPVRILIDAAAVKASGYRLYAFYP